MGDFISRFERLELKFLVDETVVDRLRPQIDLYCEPDSYNGHGTTDRNGRGGYMISSLYLDSPGLAFHQAKERGDAERIKLRVRTYSDESPATLEIKRRHRDVVVKRRAVVPRPDVEQLGNGGIRLSGCSAKAESTVSEFEAVMATSGAVPTLTVKYEREAYASVVDEYARVTFDRRIEIRRTADWDLSPQDQWCAFDNHWDTGHAQEPVVMEIKCESSIPFWVNDLIRHNQLTRLSFSKYSIGITLTDRSAGHYETRSRSARLVS
ncbi:MAG: SPX domain protein involved in polyphosphate accumulation [Hyphomicrobiaceae bacterium]|jgi:SPX domain protein involved in polyphosphate accumulation